MFTGSASWSVLPGHLVWRRFRVWLGYLVYSLSSAFLVWRDRPWLRNRAARSSTSVCIGSSSSAWWSLGPKVVESEYLLDVE